MAARLCLVSLLGWVLIAAVGIGFMQMLHSVDDIFDCREGTLVEGVDQCKVRLDGK
jgi:hypothetical protein